MHIETIIVEIVITKAWVFKNRSKEPIPNLKQRRSRAITLHWALEKVGSMAVDGKRFLESNASSILGTLK